MADEKRDQALTSGHAREAIDAATSWAGEHDGSAAGNVSGDANQTAPETGAPAAGQASSQPGGQAGQGSPNEGFSSANPPKAPSGLKTPLQPGGTVTGTDSPGQSEGSLGTGGAQTRHEG
jgi:hypothetical protein